MTTSSTISQGDEGHTSSRTGADDAGGHVIATAALTKVFRTRGADLTAVDRLDLHVHAGEIFGLLGPCPRTSSATACAGRSPAARYSGDSYGRWRGGAAARL